ncbi:MAG: dephospho-CoA kinase [Armatimonadetes bacterium]|nr:dephospho-CoA kinase [Armatimonadota bacterium]MDW8027073.1 dephospho-CoA kinase [Armatimonadota bacterium]
MTKVIGITGGIGVGKTTFLRAIQRMGFRTITADEVGRKVVMKSSPVLRALVANFGRAILTTKGELDRKKFGKWVFQNLPALHRLNHLTHPQMRRIIDAKIREWKGRGVKLIAVEAAVLFEMGLNLIVDEVWVVTASFRERLRRMEKMEQRTREEGQGMKLRRELIWQRMVRQLPDEMFRHRAHRVIVTDGRRQKEKIFCDLKGGLL